MPGKKKGYSIIYSNGNDPTVFVKVSIRNSKGKSTSRSIGSIGKLSSFLNDDEINKKANELYLTWKNNGNIATIVLDSEKDCNYPTIHLGRIYIAKYLRELGIIDKLNNLKGEKKAKYQFDFASIVETLIESQILCPSSKRNEYLSNNGLGFSKDISLQDIYRALDVLALHSAEINAYSYKKIKQIDKKNTKIYYYDCTNFYYTQGSEGELLGIKKSKEGILAPLVQMGLLIDQWGYLLGMIIFKGNKNEQPSLEQQIKIISSHIEMSSVVVCTDAGLCSFKNKMILSKNGRAYITTQPVMGNTVPDIVKDYVSDDSFMKTSSNETLKVSQLKEAYFKALEENDYSLMEQLKNTTLFKDNWFELIVKKKIAVNDKNGRKKWKEGDVNLTKEDFSKEDKDTQYSITYSRKVKSNKQSPKGKDCFFSRLLVSFSMKYYLAQMKEINKKKEQILNLINSNKNLDAIPKELKGYACVDKVTKDGELAEEQIISINNEAFKEAERFAGYYVQATNLGDEASEIYKTSRMRWQIEYCFRTMKSQIDARPIYLTTSSHIVGHFTIVFLALQTLRYMMYKLYATEGNKNIVLGRATNSIVTVDKVIDELRNMKGRIMECKEGYLIVLGANKNEINSLMSKAFNKSLTKQFIKLESLEEYSGLKLKIKE